MREYDKLVIFRGEIIDLNDATIMKSGEFGWISFREREERRCEVMM